MIHRAFAWLAVVAAALLAQPETAVAHPHVWVKMRSDVVFDDRGLITGINLAWSFDEGYVQVALDGLDANGDGDYSPSELDPLTKENIASLKDYDYFTRLKADGKDVALAEVTNYGQIYSNSKLELYFTVPLATPIDPRRSDFYYRVYDPEFFIAMDYEPDQPVSAVGSLPAGCKLDLLPVVADDQTEETRQMLAGKGKDWQPPPDEDFGAMFAQPVHVACRPAMAQQADGSGTAQPKIDKRKLLVPPRNADGSIVMTSLWDDPVQWAAERQREFYGAMRRSLTALKTDAPLAAASMLMLLSFAYGILHAAGPGHGKVVVSSWLLATESQLRRGILIAFMSAIVQALSAIAIVSILLLAVANIGTASRQVGGMAESMSYALISAMGIVLIWSAVRPRRPVHAVAGHGHHDHDGEDHAHDGHCGHAHGPGAKDLRGDWSLAKALSLAFAVGVRPCTGAILALIFAQTIGLYWAGVASTFAMALGTFLTVSMIAAVTVYSRRLALRFASRDDRWLGHAMSGLKLAGGTVIAGLGLLLFWASLGSSQAAM